LKTVLRIALPPLRELAPGAPVAFAVLDRERRVLRSGELPLDRLAGAVPRTRVEAVLHPEDSVETRIAVPPLRGPRMQAAVTALVEPLALSPVEELALAHGPRAADGTAPVAWTGRAALARAWTLLAQAGLDVAALYPARAVLPPDDPQPDAPLALPADGRWRQPSPGWSLALDDLRPDAGGGARWRAPLAWAALALAIWIGGLNLYAARLANEAQALQAAMRQQVAQAFPELPVIVDPVKQATQRRDALRAAQGEGSDGDFMPLALAAARLLPAGSRVAALDYADGKLAVELDGDAADTAAPDPALPRQAAAQGLLLERTDGGWTLAPARAGAVAPPGALRVSPGARP